MIRLYSILFLQITILAFSTLNAQEKCNENYKNLPLSGDLYDYYYKQYRGTPHFKDKSFSGKVKLISGDVFSGLDLNYDIYLDELIYFNPVLQRVIKLDKESIVEFWLEPDNGESYHIVNFHETDSSKVNSGFLFMLINDTVSLVSKKQKQIDQDNNASKSSGIVGDFVQKDSWYYVQNNTYIQLPKSWRVLYKQFPGIKKELRSFVKSNRYKIKKEYQLMAVFREINRLSKID